MKPSRDIRPVIEGLEVVFTDHALERMQERGITVENILSTLKFGIVMRQKVENTWAFITPLYKVAVSIQRSTADGRDKCVIVTVLSPDQEEFDKAVDIAEKRAFKKLHAKGPKRSPRDFREMEDDGYPD